MKNVKPKLLPGRCPFQLFLRAIFILLLVLNYVVAQNPPNSPCPELFQYHFDRGEWIGLLSLNGLQLGQTIRINMNLSLRGRLPSPYPGALQLFLSREKTLQNIVENKPVLYRILFPVQQPLPTLTRILFNNQIICAGPADIGPLVTAIKLEHTLYTQLAGQQLANQDPTPAYQIYIPESGQLGSFDIQSGNNQERPDAPIPAIGNSGFPAQNGFQSSSLPETSMVVVDNPKQRPSPSSQIEGNNGGPQFQTRPQFAETLDSHTEQIPPTKPRPTRKRRPRPPPPTSSAFVDEGNTNQENTNTGQSDGNSKLDEIAKVCGVTDAKHNVRPLVVGGEDIKRGSWPWLVAIFLNAPAQLSFQCGGNLITNRLVLTSAHCFFASSRKYAANDVIVFLGRHNILSWDEKGWISSSVDGIYTHPDYKNDNLSFDADLALILLRNEVRFNEYIRPVCLWPTASTSEEIEGETGVVVGWGRNEAGQRVTETPKRVETVVVSDLECLRSNEQFRLLTSNRTFCAGHRDGKGPCTGDSGGGMMMYRSRKWWIRGMVSASLLDAKKSSCNLNEYVIYVDISKFLDWIKSFMQL